MRSRWRWTVRVIGVGLLFSMIGSSSAAAAGKPKTQIVNYTYNAIGATVTLYTSKADGLTYFTSASLQIDGGAVRTDALCWMSTYDSNGTLAGDSTCVFSGVSAPGKTLALTAALEDPPSGAESKTYTGDFSDTCRQFSSQGCTGDKTVRLTAPRQ